jgi:hypothetical protein
MKLQSKKPHGNASGVGIDSFTLPNAYEVS